MRRCMTARIRLVGSTVHGMHQDAVADSEALLTNEAPLELAVATEPAPALAHAILQRYEQTHARRRRVVEPEAGDRRIIVRMPHQRLVDEAARGCLGLRAPSRGVLPDVILLERRQIVGAGDGVEHAAGVTIVEKECQVTRHSENLVSNTGESLYNTGAT